MPKLDRDSGTGKKDGSNSSDAVARPTTLAEEKADGGWTRLTKPEGAEPRDITTAGTR